MPNYAFPWNGLGNLYTDHLQRFDEAENAYLKAIALDANDAFPWYGLGNLYTDHLQRFDEAENAYLKAIALDANYAFPWNGLGNLYTDHLQRFDEAENAYQQAIRIDPNGSYPRANLAHLTVLQGNPEKASSHYRTLLELVDQGSDSHHELILQANLWLNNQDAAAQALNALAVAASSGDAFAFFRIKEQTIECWQLTIGGRLAALMRASDHAGFLEPFALALLATDGDTESLLAAAEEIRRLAEDIQKSLF